MKLSSRISFDRLCKLLGVDTWEKILEETPEFCEYNPDLTEEQNQKVEEDAAEESLKNYHAAVMKTAEEVFGYHNLELVPVAFRRKMVPPVWEFRIVPTKNWKEAANSLRETINGAGPFYFSSLKEFLSSGPYTPRQAVLSHLGWIPDWYEVYEGRKASTRVQNRLRY